MSSFRTRCNSSYVSWNTSLPDMSLDYRSDVCTVEWTCCSILILLLDWETKPKMAPFEDLQGEQPGNLPSAVWKSILGYYRICIRIHAKKYNNLRVRTLLGPEHDCEHWTTILIAQTTIWWTCKIARINGSSSNDDGIVVLGAHLDRSVLTMIMWSRRCYNTVGLTALIHGPFYLLLVRSYLQCCLIVLTVCRNQGLMVTSWHCIL